MPDSLLPASDHDYVAFARPPVQEVALAAQLTAQVIDLEIFAAFAAATRAELPGRQYQPALPPIEEVFDLPGGGPNFQIAFTPDLALPRAWLIGADNTWLVQLQADRLTVNWRRLDEGGEYPRYGEVRRRLVHYLDVLEKCLADAGSPAPRFNFGEVTYVNSIIDPSVDAGQHPHVATFLRDVRPWHGNRFLPEPEDMQARARWRITGEDGAPIGRLYLVLSPGFRPTDNMPIYSLNLTSRVIPRNDRREGVLSALDLGHRWCALGFDDLTTPAMHKMWERREGGD